MSTPVSVNSTGEEAGGLTMALPALPPDELSESLLFLDVPDIPRAARVARQWNNVLRSIEEEHWLALIRRHYPILEPITLMLPEPVEGDGHDNVGSMVVSSGRSNGIPAPSRNWRRQFQRERMLLALQQQVQPPPVPEPNLSPAPLSSYCIRVELILFSDENTKIGTLSTLADGLQSDGRFGIRVPIQPELRCYLPLTHFDLRLTMYQKSSGKQVVLYSSAPFPSLCVNFGFRGNPLRREWLLYRSYRTVTRQPDTFLRHISGLPAIIPAMYEACIKCNVLVKRTCCICNCQSDRNEPEGFISTSETLLPPKCSCCTCEEKWQCFYGMNIDLEFVYDCGLDEDEVELTQLQQLQLLERLDFV